MLLFHLGVLEALAAFIVKVLMILGPACSALFLGVIQLQKILIQLLVLNFIAFVMGSVDSSS